MKPLNWTTIPQGKIKNSIWEKVISIKFKLKYNA